MANKIFNSLLASGSALDPDAQAFITATGIVDETQIGAINTLVVGLKADSLWTKFYACYPLVGGSEATCKYNLVDPRDLDAAYRLTKVGAGGTFDANGWTPSGSTIDYLNTHLNGSTVLSRLNSHYSYYSRTNWSDPGGITSDYGALNGSNCEVYTNDNGTLRQDIPDFNGGADRINIAVANSLGFYNGCLGAANVVVYKNGVSIGAKGSAAAGNYSNADMLFSNGQGAAAIPAVRNLAFASIGQDLTAGEAADLYTLVQAFQTTLSRQV